MLCLSGFELYYRWVPLNPVNKRARAKRHFCASLHENTMFTVYRIKLFRRATRKPPDWASVNKNFNTQGDNDNKSRRDS